MVSPERVRCSCARPSCTRPLEDGEVDDGKADGDLDTLEEELEKNENGQQVSHRAPREGGDGDEDVLAEKALLWGPLKFLERGGGDMRFSCVALAGSLD
ncbi:hypothetical protein NUW58_g2615 [Xylaria curta]|uniref:Uncharacterized protein n=1 Tax=Xylaria curta TaxID=42375 RepID=A0ACC1PF85_9PEZI|nr:hypothetical protein NUW58_g2615 [Xylaria curta]